MKEGVALYLDRLRRDGVRMCVASATALPLMKACLDRLGVLDYFDFLLSCEEVGWGKDRPDVYHEAARRLGASPGEIAVYEDALGAAKTDVYKRQMKRNSTRPTEYRACRHRVPTPA